jgi:hypothetical protein
MPPTGHNFRHRRRARTLALGRQREFERDYAAALSEGEPGQGADDQLGFMTRKGTPAGRGVRATAATRETGPGTTILRRH